jgi:adenosylhomocysteine nucleosidase
VAKDIVAAIVMATMLEAKPFVQEMSLKQIPDSPFIVFRNPEVQLLVSGIGKANAAMATAYLCTVFNPALIFNLGAAGAARFGYGLGEIFHIHEVVEPDRPDLKTGKLCIHKPDLMEGFKTAKLATSDRAILDPINRQAIARNADLLDMEGASVVQTCRKFESRCFLFKFVSDTPDHKRDQDIVDHIRRYRQRFCEFFVDTVIPKSQQHLT